MAMTIFSFILLSMLSTFVGVIGLIVVLSCVVLILDIISFVLDKIFGGKKYETVFDEDFDRKKYQGNEDTNE